MATRFLLAGILLGVVLAFTFGISVGPSDTQPGKHQLAAVHAVYDGTGYVILIRMNTQTGAIDACRKSRSDISDRDPTVLVGPAQHR